MEAWRGVLSRYAQEYRFPDVARVEVAEINSAETLLALPELESDLFVVSGTNLVRAPLIEFANSGWGMLNLHSGLSPHVKGGPNCTNWCLAQGWFELIGNTVMWIDLGVDSGDIAAAERTPLDGTESLEELHWKVLEHAHELLLRVIDRIAAGEDVPGVSQAEIGAGRTFRNAEWGAKAMLSARRNFRRRYAQALPR